MNLSGTHLIKSFPLLLTLTLVLCLSIPPCEARTMNTIEITRLLDHPIITPDSHPSIGTNIQGPSLIRVPAWVKNPLGKYYLYFADHKGAYIRLAYADELQGPWTVHVPGSLQLADSHFPVQPPPVPAGGAEKLYARYRASGVDPDKLPHDPMIDMTVPHIASPDVHVDEDRKRIVMYFHGLESFGVQVSRMATSTDGIHFTAEPPILAQPYMRVFEYKGETWALAMPGQFYRRTADGGFEKGPLRFNPNMRHSAVLVRGHQLFVFWTQVGNAPERILVSTIDLSAPWDEWRESEAVEVLRPERTWEGADAPPEPSQRSVAYGVVNQLRDPAIFEEDGTLYLLYAVAGERGIAIAGLQIR